MNTHDEPSDIPRTGSNLGDRLANITEALQALRSKVVIRVAGLYDTAPVGNTEQPRSSTPLRR
ncbi:MAG: 2-amino-4-hydroxy-6-hydroxymethyldihydropteridine diphosphokinase [Chloroflexia bacterium]